jgi:titin
LTSNSAPISGYAVTPYLGGVAQPTRIFSSPTLTQTVTGLVDGSTYRFTVAAINAMGRGPESTKTDSVTIGSPPAAPAPASVVAGPRSATVTWTIPSDGGSPITGFRILVGRTGQYFPSVIRTAGPTETSLTVGSLPSGDPHWVQVAAVNAVGDGPLAYAGRVVPLGAAPDAPGSASATPGSGSALVSWTAVPYDGGSPVVGYVVTPYLDGLARPALTFLATDRTQTVAGLTDGETYEFTVAAINANGTGPESPRSSPVQVGVPLAPSAPDVIPGDASATVSWVAPPDNGSPITGYVVTPLQDGVPRPAHTFASTATSQTVSGLLNGARYTFRVAAINANGTGLTSGLSQSVTVGVPGAPAPASVETGPLEVTVSWTMPYENGAPILGYWVRFRNEAMHSETSFWVEPTETSFTVPRPTVPYSLVVTVEAVNELGASPPAQAGTVLPPG